MIEKQYENPNDNLATSNKILQKQNSENGNFS